MRFLALILLFVAGALAECAEDSDCPDLSTCEIGLCANETCTTAAIGDYCECGDGNVTEPYEECDGDLLCSENCTKLGLCLRWNDTEVSCEDAVDSADCLDGHFVLSANCSLDTACCDDGECTEDPPPLCFGFGGRPRGRINCSAIPDPCLAGACCSAKLLYGAWQGCLPVFFESECCAVSGILKEEENNCTRLGTDSADRYSLICDFGACVCVSGLDQKTCTETTKEECECDWIPLASCDDPGRCGLLCANVLLISLLLLIAFGCCALGCCTNGFLWVASRKEHDD